MSSHHGGNAINGGSPLTLDQDMDGLSHGKSIYTWMVAVGTRMTMETSMT